MAAVLLMASVLTGMGMHVTWNTTLDQMGTLSHNRVWRVHVAGEVTLIAMQLENKRINVTKLNTSTGAMLSSVVGLGDIAYRQTEFVVSGQYFAMMNLYYEVCVYEVSTLGPVLAVWVGPNVSSIFALKGDTLIYRDTEWNDHLTARSTKTGAKLWTASSNGSIQQILIGDTLVAMCNGLRTSVFHVDTGVLAYDTPSMAYGVGRTSPYGHIFDAANNLVAMNADVAAYVFSPHGRILANYSRSPEIDIRNANILPDSSLIVTIQTSSTKGILRLDKTGEQMVWNYNTTITDDSPGVLHLMPERGQLAVVSFPSGLLEVLSLETGKRIGLVAPPPPFDYRRYGELADDGEGNIIFGTSGFTATGKEVISVASAKLPW